MTAAVGPATVTLTHQERNSVCRSAGEHVDTTCDELQVAVTRIVAARVGALTVDLEAAHAAAWDEGVDAAFRGAITRQNGEDVKRRNPYRGDGLDSRTHGGNHAPLPAGTWLAPGFCAGCDEVRSRALLPAAPTGEGS